MNMMKNTQNNRRPLRLLGKLVNQIQMFHVHGLFSSQIEGIASVIEADYVLNVSRTFTRPWCIRTDQYAVYKKDPNEPLGKEVTWIEKGIQFVHKVPDVPVKFNGREISLQKAAAMGIYDSINWLRIEQTDPKRYVVSAIDLEYLAGNIRAVDFIRDGWALTDGYGFPLTSKPAIPGHPNARYGHVVWFDPRKGDISGWHGSISRNTDWMLCDKDGRRGVFADDGWFDSLEVAVMHHKAIVPWVDDLIKESAFLKKLAEKIEEIAQLKM
ncbi:MAG: hypothetical protein WC501_01225 [Candidatus Micrarchaeia archaeon]